MSSPLLALILPPVVPIIAWLIKPAPNPTTETDPNQETSP